MTLSPRCSVTTRATTAAPATSGWPTCTLLPSPTINTRSNVTSSPSSTTSRSTSSVWPGVTRYCLPPVSIIAYCNPHPSQQAGAVARDAPGTPMPQPSLTVTNRRVKEQGTGNMSPAAPVVCNVSSLALIEQPFDRVNGHTLGCEVNVQHHVRDGGDEVLAGALPHDVDIVCAGFHDLDERPQLPALVRHDREAEQLEVVVPALIQRRRFGFRGLQLDTAECARGLRRRDTVEQQDNLALLPRPAGNDRVPLPIEEQLGPPPEPRRVG